MKFNALLRATIAVVIPNLAAAAPSIINGTDVPSASQYPFMVGVFPENKICGGTILSTTMVVTAAHCVHLLQANVVTLRAGSLQFSEGGINPITVSQVIEHPKYDAGNLDYDVAILKLASPLEFSSTVSAATLVASGADPVEGTTTTTMGWGQTDPVIEGLSPNLKEVDVHVISRSTCQANYLANNPPYTVTDRMFCSGEVIGGKDSCQGDSGGPIIDKATGVLLGAVSWGVGCAQPGLPGVYTSFANSEIAAFIRAQVTPARRSFRWK